MVAKALCIRLATFYDWLAFYRGGEWVALKAGKRGGCKPKPCGILLKWVYATVTMGGPLQIEFPVELWTRQVIAFSPGKSVVKMFFESLTDSLGKCRLGRS
jgi:hypothetical protein